MIFTANLEWPSSTVVTKLSSETKLHKQEVSIKLTVLYMVSNSSVVNRPISKPTSKSGSLMRWSILERSSLFFSVATAVLGNTTDTLTLQNTLYILLTSWQINQEKQLQS